jgi:NAD(P)-dependent dehydrogenase (short-subunit alcohol dehydrogenase family)
MGPKYGGNKTDDELIELVAASLPMGKIGKPDDIANVITFFLSDLSGFVTGQILCASGGQ